MIKPKFGKRIHTPTVIQMEKVECGAAALGIVLGYFGKYVPLEELRLECGVSRDGSKAIDIIEAAKKYGLVAQAAKKTANELFDIDLPAILFWEFNHFLVLEGFKRKRVYLNDPATGPRSVTYEMFEESYTGILISFQKGENFKKSGSPPSLIGLLYNRLKEIPHPMTFIFLAGICLLLPGFALPAMLAIFINMYFVQNSLSWSFEFLGAVLFTALFSGLLTWLQLYFLNRLKNTLSMRFSSDFLWHLLKLPMNFYTQRYSGEIAFRTRLNDTVADVLTNSLITATIQFLLIVFYGALMFFYNYAIAWIAVIFGLINMIVMYRIFKSRSNAYACLQQDLAKSIGESIGALLNIETIKSKGIESDFFSRWAGYYSRNLNSHQEIEKKDITLIVLPIFFQSIALAALLGIGSLRIIDGTLSIGMLMGFQVLQTNFFLPINRFVSMGTLIQNMKRDLLRLDDVMKNEIDPIYKVQPTQKIKKLNGSLEFRDVSFQYSSRTQLVIKNLSFLIKPRQRLALVGPTGSGKSSIAKLATGLFRPTSGQILYDGTPLDEIPIEVLRNSIASVDQEIFLFAGTIRENMTFWNNEVPDEALITAARDACIHEEISMRDRGYDSILIEEGRNLSGGQRQRIEIARALLYNPSLLILDEATSALDSKTEKLISDKIVQRGSSALMIAHRLSTIQDCDEIIVLDKGVAIQRGKHRELKAVEGMYKQLVERELLSGSWKS